MKFIIRKATDNQFYFIAVANNGNTLLTSETYKRKASAKKSIESIRRKIDDAKVIDESGIKH